jgi:2-keto-4-pentenoate hydratase/2-oxohepta-3-ene-1,7-dioic acid hydratase in catechol pathway
MFWRLFMDKIICVGKNYADHSAELGDAHPEKPVLFIKPPSVLRRVFNNNETIELSLPSHSKQVHHEVELVFRIDHGGFRMSIEQAERALGAVTVGLDMTLRDLQMEAKNKGTPWTTGKVFPDAAVVGPWLELKTLPQFADEEFSLSLDGSIKQRAYAKQMSHSPAECLAYASQFIPICAGDIFFTGTPVGVGPVSVGQTAQLRFNKVIYNVRWTETV